MKFLIMVLLITSLQADCSKHLNDAHKAMKEFTPSGTEDYYTKWSNIASTHLDFYNSCLLKEQNEMIQENHSEMMRALNMVSNNEVSVSMPSEYGSGY